MILFWSIGWSMGVINISVDVVFVGSITVRWHNDFYFSKGDYCRMNIWDDDSDISIRSYSNEHDLYHHYGMIIENSIIIMIFIWEI